MDGNMFDGMERVLQTGCVLSVAGAIAIIYVLASLLLSSQFSDGKLPIPSVLDEDDFEPDAETLNFVDGLIAAAVKAERERCIKLLRESVSDVHLAIELLDMVD